jgi:hypothetical protein
VTYADATRARSIVGIITIQEYITQQQLQLLHWAKNQDTYKQTQQLAVTLNKQNVFWGSTLDEQSISDTPVTNRNSQETTTDSDEFTITNTITNGTNNNNPPTFAETRTPTGSYQQPTTSTDTY